MTGRQLKLVVDAPAPQFGSTHPTRQVFEHWLFMFRKSPARCKLDPARRAVINAALALYDADTLFLAVEGMADDELDGCNDRQRAAMREVEWLLARGSRIERWAERGDALRLRELAAADALRRRAIEPLAEPADPAALAARKERLRALAEQSRGAAYG